MPGGTERDKMGENWTGRAWSDTERRGTILSAEHIGQNHVRPGCLKPRTGEETRKGRGQLGSPKGLCGQSSGAGALPVGVWPLDPGLQYLGAG